MAAHRKAAMHPTFVVNTLHLALVSIRHGQLYAAERYLETAETEIRSECSALGMSPVTCRADSLLLARP
jgi:hypothetical protein